MVLLRIRVPPLAALQVVRFAFVAWSTYFLPYSIQKSRFGSGWEEQCGFTLVAFGKTRQPRKVIGLRTSKPDRADR